MENGEIRYIRTDIKRNTLAKEIFRIDFYPLDDFDNVLEELEKYFREKGYTYNYFTTTNVTFDINDPEPLITESFMIKKNIEIIQNYEFVNVDESCKFILNQNMLIFDKGEFTGYNGIENYFDLFLGAINVIKDISTLKLSRLGIRKINELILSSKEYVINYFNNAYLNDLKHVANDAKEMILEYSFRPFYGNDSLSLNKNIKIIKGKFKTKENEIIDAYSFIWDIDSYKRFNSEEELQLSDICTNINNKIFDEYCDVISDDLYEILKDEIKDDGILGGLKNGAN